MPCRPWHPRRRKSNAVPHQKPNLTQGQRDHPACPQFALERDERHGCHENAPTAPKFMHGNALVEWNTRKTISRREMESACADFREALRQSPAAGWLSPGGFPQPRPIVIAGDRGVQP